MASKYKSVRVEVDGIKFDSKREAARYQELKLRERAGEIRTLRVHPRFPMVINGKLATTYVADFTYFPASEGPMVIEDVKGVETAIFRLKRKLLNLIYGVDVVVVR